MDHPIDSPDFKQFARSSDPVVGPAEVWEHVALIRNRWWLILLCAVLSLGFMAWRQRDDEAVYRAEATVQTKYEKPPIDIAMGNTQPNMVSELEILRSSAVLGSAVDALGIEASDRISAITAFRSRLTVVQVPGTNLIRIQYSASDPQYATDAANAVATAYRDFSARKSIRDANTRRSFITDQMAIVAESLSVAQQAILSYQARAGVFDTQGAGGEVTAQLAQVENEVRTLRFQESVAQSLSQLLRDSEDDDAYRRVSIVGRDVIPGATELYSRLQTLAADRSRLTASRFGQTGSGVQVQIIDSLTRSTKREVRAVTDQTLSALRVRRAQAEQRLAELNAERGALPAQANELSRLTQRADAIQKTFDMLAARKYEAQIAEAMQSGLVEIVDRATVPKFADPTNSRRRLIVALLGGAIAGLLLAYLVEFLNTRIRTGSDAVRSTGLNLLGAIPTLKPQNGNAAAAQESLQDQSGAGAEAFRMLRTALQFSKAEPPHVVAVTSAGPGEGKSLIALNLAASIGRSGGNALLIDGDLRRPTVHNQLGLRRLPGLSDVLVGAAKLEDALIPNVLPGLSVLPCGSATPSPAELLGSRRFADLLVQLREQYDSITVDTPPVLAVTDATVLMPALDGVLLIVRSNKTDRYALAQTMMQLNHVHASVLGIVLNCAPPAGAYGAYGGHYGYYGYRYSEYYTKPSRSRLKILAGR